jgi:hypothetical protein
VLVAFLRVILFSLCCNRCHGDAVKAFGALWDNTYGCVFTALDFPVILDGQFTGIPLNTRTKGRNFAQ